MNSKVKSKVESYDVMAIGAHPDDVELACSGTILKYVAMGKEIGVVDLTAGELGTRGSAELREKEAEAASKLLGIKVRENLKIKDGFADNSEQSQMAVINVIRK